MLIGIDASRTIAPRLTGTERYSREIIVAMTRHSPQHRYRLYFRAGDDATRAQFLASMPTNANIEAVVIAQPRLWTHIGLGREVTARPPDALFVPSHTLPWRVPPKICSVVTVHDVGYKHFPQAHPLRQRLYLDWATGHAARTANVIIADSNATAQDVARYYAINSSKLRVAYPGALPLVDAAESDISTTLMKFGLAREQPFALHIGTMQPRKNLRRLIEAWSRASRPDGAQLVLAGGAGWGSEDLSASIAAAQVTGSVKIIGYISDAEKAVLLKCASAYVLPSLYEGFGFPVLEAQLAGVPVTCSNTSSLTEVAGDAALYFDPLDIHAVAQSITQVMNDSQLRKTLTDAGHRNVRRFTWDVCAAIVLRALEDGA